MAIQPIDLQALFTQIDKVAKTQGAQREGLAIQQAIQGAEHQRKTDEHIQSVNEAQDVSEGVQKVKDKIEREPDGKRKKKKVQPDSENNGDEKIEGDKEKSFFRHPLMGRNIDISL